MATVFWGGETFAPKRRVKRGVYRGGLGGGLEEEEVGLQEFLQTCMIEAFGALGDRVKNCEAVVGFEVRTPLFASFPPESHTERSLSHPKGHQRTPSRLHRTPLALLVGLQNRPRHRLLPLRCPRVPPSPPPSLPSPPPLLPPTNALSPPAGPSDPATPSSSTTTAPPSPSRPKRIKSSSRPPGSARPGSRTTGAFGRSMGCGRGMGRRVRWGSRLR